MRKYGWFNERHPVLTVDSLPDEKVNVAAIVSSRQFEAVGLFKNNIRGQHLVKFFIDIIDIIPPYNNGQSSYAPWACRKDIIRAVLFLKHLTILHTSLFS